MNNQHNNSFRHSLDIKYLFRVIESIMGNEFISKDLKKSIHVAGKKGARSPGSCDLYKCHHHLLPQQFW